jgi:hypothetical protein
MTHSARVLTAHAVLDHLMAQVGVDGLVAAVRNPGLMAAVDQHSAAIRETLQAAGHDLGLVSLADYARPLLAALSRGGHPKPDGGAINWARAGEHVIQLVAVCAMADSAGL